MNTEIIKIEPPIVVKEELEVDNNKHIEVKLENEEKPQLVEDIMPEKSNPSISEFFEEDGYDFDESFAVAKDENYGTKLEDEVKPQLFEDFILIENKPSTSGTVEEDEASYLVIKDLDFCGNKNFEVKLENEEKPHVLEEFEPEENERLPSKIVKMNESDLDEIILLTCSHCGEKRTSSEMVQTPETEDELMKWCNVLGEEFSETFTIRSPVCRNHFIDEFGDSRLVDIIRKNGSIETKLGDRLRCCYCGESRMSRSTTKVPIDNFFTTKWIEILGKDFEECFKKHKHGCICRSHFDTEWKGQRPKHLLPVANKKHLEQNVIIVPEKTITETMIAERKVSLPSLNTRKKMSTYNITCVYCEEKKTSQYMTMVPPNPNTLKIWRDILGEEFYRNALSKRLPFICRSHFDIKWEHTRPYYVLPCVESGQLSSHEVKKEEYSKLKSFNLLMKDHTPVERKDRTLIKENYKETNLSTCCCCGATKSLMEMVETPETVKELLEWYRILGETFYKNSRNSKSSMVCRSHFDDELRKKKPGELSRISFLNEKPRLYNVTRIVRQYQKVDTNDQYTILCVCAYCGVRKPLRIMTMIPFDPNTLRQWGQILGEDFYRNALADRYSSICRSHFNVEWIHIRPPNLLPRAVCVPSDQVIRDNSKTRDMKLKEPEMNEDSDKKSVYLHDKHIKTQIQSQELESEMKLDKNSEFPKQKVAKKKPCTILCLCAYCGETKPIRIMTTTPYDPNTLRQWGQILGEKFYMKALGDGNSFICRSHFNVGWSHNRPPYILPHAMNENSNKNSEIPKYINKDGHSDRKKIKLEANEAK